MRREGVASKRFATVHALRRAETLSPYGDGLGMHALALTAKVDVAPFTCRTHATTTALGKSHRVVSMWRQVAATSIDPKNRAPSAPAPRRVSEGFRSE